MLRIIIIYFFHLIGFFQNFIQCVLTIFTPSSSFSEIEFPLPFLLNFVSFLVLFVCFLLNPLSPNCVTVHVRMRDLLLESPCTLYVLVSWVLWTKGNAMIYSILYYLVLRTTVWEVEMKKWLRHLQGSWDRVHQALLIVDVYSTAWKGQHKEKGLSLSHWEASAGEHSQVVRRGNMQL